MTAEEQAEQLWNAVEVAAAVLPKGARVSLGIVSPEVLQALARLSGAEVDGALYLDMAPGPTVIEGLRGAFCKGIPLEAQAEARPATPGDVALYVACRLGSRPSKEEVAKALLGVSP